MGSDITLSYTISQSENKSSKTMMMKTSDEDEQEHNLHRKEKGAAGIGKNSIAPTDDSESSEKDDFVRKKDMGRGDDGHASNMSSIAQSSPNLARRRDASKASGKETTPSPPFESAGGGGSGGAGILGRRSLAKESVVPWESQAKKAEVGISRDM
tara:strand:- start:295 stop:759 length:465 start_codon:yes stop_codon:yes gene_type:complete